MTRVSLYDKLSVSIQTQQKEICGRLVDVFVDQRFLKFCATTKHLNANLIQASQSCTHVPYILSMVFKYTKFNRNIGMQQKKIR